MAKKFFLSFVFASAAFAVFASGANPAAIVNAHKQAQYGKPIPFYKVPGSKAAMSLVIENGILYALERDGLSVYDISDPKKPARIGFVGGMGNVRQLCVSGKTAFLSSRQCGLWSVDVSDPRNPKIISNFDTVEMATGLDVVGNLAVVGNRVFGVQCIDVSDPAHMKHVSSLRTDESQSVLYRDGIIYSGDWAGGEITVIDASNLSSLKPISKIKLDGYGDGIVARGNTLFASTGQHKKSGPENARHGAGHGLDIFDISNPAAPKKLSKTAFPTIYFGPCDYWTPRLSGNYCFASDTINGVFLVDISNLSKPKILGNLILPKKAPDDPKMCPPFKFILDPKLPQGDPVSSVAVGDGVLYIAGTFTGIYIAELPGIAKPEKRDFGKLPKLPKKPFDASESGFITSGEEPVNQIRAVAIDGDTAYAANLWGGVKVFSLSEPAKPKIGKSRAGHIAEISRKSSLKITPVRVEKIPYVADIKKSGRRMFTAEGLNGLGVYDILSDGSLREVGRLRDIGESVNFVQYVWAFDGCDIVAFSNAQSKMIFADVSNPAKPAIVGKTATYQLMYGNYGSQNLVKGRYFMFNRHCGGYIIYDFAGGKPRLVVRDDFPMCSQTGSVAAFGDKFLAMRCGSYAFVDPENIVPTKELVRIKFPTQKEFLKDVVNGTAIERAMFPKSDFEGFVNFDPSSGKLAVANKMFNVCRTYDFSDPENPKLLKKYNLKSHPNVPAFWRGRMVLPGGHSGLLIEK